MSDLLISRDIDDYCGIISMRGGNNDYFGIVFMLLCKT